MPLTVERHGQLTATCVPIPRFSSWARSAGVSLLLKMGWGGSQSEQVMGKAPVNRAGRSHVCKGATPEKNGDTGRRAGNISCDIPQCWPMSLGTGVPKSPKHSAPLRGRIRSPSSEFDSPSDVSSASGKIDISSAFLQTSRSKRTVHCPGRLGLVTLDRLLNRTG